MEPGVLRARAVDLAQMHDDAMFPDRLGRATGDRAVRRDGAGQPERAVEALESIVPHYDAQMLLAILWNGTNLGEAYLRVGRLSEARTTLRAVVENAEASGMRFYQACALRLLGECASATAGDPETRQDAVRYFERAIALLGEIGAENELAFAHAAYGRLCRESNDNDEARRHLTRAAEIFERLGTLAEPETVRRQLAELT